MLNLIHKNILITGASSGIGKVTAIELAKMGANIFLAGRSIVKHEAVIKELYDINSKGNFVYLPLELANLDSVRSCAKLFLDFNQPLHILINNAGVYGEKGITQQGFEMHFGVNHLGHFLLTLLLLDRIKASAPSRILNLASGAHRYATQWDWEALQKPTKSMTTMTEYGVSKLSNILFTTELAEQLKDTDVLCLAIHPGIVKTDIWRHLPSVIQPLMNIVPILTPLEGTKNTLYGVTECPASEHGQFLTNCQRETPSILGQDAFLAKELWRRSLEWAGLNTTLV
jgi:NAD(P)-dependent dehydrogenase (short-subunit alcohol dehydrogenase family)